MLREALMTHVFKHPKYYKELRSIRNKSDQAISKESSTEENRRAPRQGHKRQAASVKPQALSIKLLDYLPLIKFYGVKTKGLN